MPDLPSLNLGTVPVNEGIARPALGLNQAERIAPKTPVGLSDLILPGAAGNSHHQHGRADAVIVNVIPHEFSSEATYQSEPSIAVNPQDPSQIVIGTFGPLPGHGGLNPYFTSDDGGATWSNFSFHNYSHGDTSMEWSTSGTAYAVLLNNNLNPRRSDNPTVDDPANQFMTIPGGNYGGLVDQPWIKAAQVDGADHIYVGFNGSRSTVRFSTDSGASWSNEEIDRQPGGVGDAPPTRLGINGETVYATFEHRTAAVGGDYRGDVVIVRDDNGGNGGPGGRFRDLGDTGVTIASDAILPGPNYPTDIGTTLGSERIRSSISIVVDPGDDQRVFVAYTAVENGGPHIHLDASTDGGASWIEVYQIADQSALPSLAITPNGVVGMLYTSLTDGYLQTHLLESVDNLATTDDTLLFAFPDGDPRFLSNPYIGDYQNLQAVDETFFGTFTASNDLNTAYSPVDVVMQRETYTDPDTGVFQLNDLNGHPVAFSLDPYFFTSPAESS
jgi:hypothetical protein